MKPLTVFVDVEGTLVSEDDRAPIAHVVDHVRELASGGATLYCWSSNGAEDARSCARELGIDELFEGFLPKPDVMLDDVHPQDWSTLTVAHPDSLQAGSDGDYAAIMVLTGIEHVRRRPGMYVGDLDQRGLHHLVFWLLRDIFTPMRPTAPPRSVRLRLLAPNALELSDDRPRSRLSEEELCKLAEALCTSASLLNDLAVVNALSERFELDLWCEGEGWTVEYERGVRVRGPFEVKGLPGSGTRVRLIPDAQIFTTVEFEEPTIATRLDELAALYGGVEVVFESCGSTRTWRRPAGLRDWINEWEPSSSGSGERTYHGSVAAGEVRCEVAWRWVEAAAPQVRSWVNSVETRGGGSHVAAFLRNTRSQAPEDGRVLFGAVHVVIPHPRFKAPIKSVLDVPEVGAFVKAAVRAALLDVP